MSVYHPGSEAEARTIIGYYDDSATSLVAGTAGDGDIVVLNEMITGTGADRQLRPTPGVRVFGRGPNTGLKGFGWKPYDPTGTAGTGTACAFGNWTLDLDGLAAATGGVSAAHGGFTSEDVSFAAYRCRIINSDAATAGGNNVTITNLSGSSAIQALFDACDISDANLDCLSTKGGGSGGNTSAVVRFFNGIIATHGSVGSNQCVSDHEGVAIGVYSSSVVANQLAATSLAWETATDGFESANSKLVNCSVVGGIRRLHTIQGCTIDVDGEDCRDWRVLEDCLLSGGVNTNGGYTLLFPNATNPTGWSTTARIRNVYETGEGSGNGLFCINGTPVGLDIDGYGCFGKYRGIDIRSAGAASTISNAALDASQYGLLWDDTPGLSPAGTVTNVVSPVAGFSSSPTGYTVQADISSELAAYRAAANVNGATQPGVTDGWSSAVLEAYYAAVGSLVCSSPIVIATSRRSRGC